VLAPEGTKPRRDPSWSAPSQWGFIVLSGEADTLTALDVEATLAAIVADSRSGCPEGTSIELVTSPAAFLGRYEEHQANERKRYEAEQARRDRERQRKQAAAARHNAVVGRLNAALGEELIHRVRDDGYSEPTEVSLTIAQAEALADLLDAITGV
jgi:hypothetical protein